MIEQMIETCKSEELRSQWTQQQQALKKWQKGKTLTKLEIGMQVDVRDKAYVWSTGTVKLIVESPQRDPLIVVRMQDGACSTEEVFQKDSPRLALVGTYTSREELPSYEIFSSKIVNQVRKAPSSSEKPQKKFKSESDKQVFEFFD
jgi:hypothetical protein